MDQRLRHYGEIVLLAGPTLLVAALVGLLTAALARGTVEPVPDTHAPEVNAWNCPACDCQPASDESSR